MGTAFKKAIIVFIGFIVILGGVLIGVIRHYSQYGSLPETIQMVDFSGNIAISFRGVHPEFGKCCVNFLVSARVGK